jgi:hypothetical protein
MLAAMDEPGAVGTKIAQSAGIGSGSAIHKEPETQGGLSAVLTSAEPRILLRFAAIASVYFPRQKVGNEQAFDEVDN